MENKTAISWQKIDHFTNEPYKKNTKSGSWYIVDYIFKDMRICQLNDGARELTKGGCVVGRFKTLKAAKEYAETITE